MSPEWLIVGGGIHGVHLAARLIIEVGVQPDRLMIVDPADRLLDRWQSCTEVTGMQFLRSPAVHHLDIHHASLQHYAGKKQIRKTDGFAEPYARPALKLFNDHSYQLIQSLGLDALHKRDRAVSSKPHRSGVMVKLAREGWLEAQNVILAIGASEQPSWPDWAPRGHDRVHHIFDPGFSGWPTAEGEKVTVVGGGISAAQVALRLAGQGHQVRLVTRHEFRVHQFDSDPGWLGPRERVDFDRQKQTSRRREIITDARHRGSIPPDVSLALRRALQEKKILWDQQGVKELFSGDEMLGVQFEDGRVMEADRVLLATGFSPVRPGGKFIDQLVGFADLPCAECGFPIVDGGLKWHSRVRVTGPLAELEVGPVSRNIAGARIAGERIVSTVKERSWKKSVKNSISEVFKGGAGLLQARPKQTLQSVRASG
jgi:hypothetical protein